MKVITKYSIVLCMVGSPHDDMDFYNHDIITVLDVIIMDVAAITPHLVY